MVSFETLDEVSCIKGSEGAVRKANEILSFIGENGGKVKINSYSLVLKDDAITFALWVTIPMQDRQS
jgi:hypothetical protein